MVSWQDELDERQAMLVSLEREKSRAVEELSEQNHKLLNQLQRVSFPNFFPEVVYLIWPNGNALATRTGDWRLLMVGMVLPDPFRGMETWETQRSGYASRFGPEENGRSNAKDGALERLGCRQSKRRWVRSCSWWQLPEIGGQKMTVTMAAKSG